MSNFDFGQKLTGPMLYPGKLPQWPKGYAAPPGSGPPGMTCKVCKHYTHKGNNSQNSYPACALTRERWTNGPGTDIKASSKACSKWEAL